jgi:hypothetical protein
MFLKEEEGEGHRLNMELDPQILFELLCIAVPYSLAENQQLPPSTRIWAHIRGSSWSENIDDISL